MMATRPDFAQLFHIGCSFAPSRVLLTAIELDLFTQLQTPSTSQQIQHNLQLHPHAVADFLDTLVSLHIIQRYGVGKDALYSNTPSSATFLVPTSPDYRGGWLKLCATRQYYFWGHLTEALQTGNLQNNVKDVFKDINNSSSNDLNNYMQATFSQTADAHIVFSSNFDFSPYQTVLDIGGATGFLSCQIVKQHSHIKAYTMDLPNVTKHAQNYILQQGYQNRVNTIEADLCSCDFQSSDVIIMSMILHAHDLEMKKSLMKKVWKALNPNGVFVAIEMLIDDDRRHHFWGLLMSLNMLLETSSGFDYTMADFTKWAAEIGFSKTCCVKLSIPYSAAIAYK